MTDYSKYSYSGLLESLDTMYEDSSDRKNYAEYLLGMEKATTIKECIKIYDKVYNRFHLKGTSFPFLDNDLALCLNENIMRLLTSSADVTSADILCTLANLRPCDGIARMRQEVLKLGNQRVTDNFSAFMTQTKEIMEAQKDYQEASRQIEGKLKGTNGYKKAVKQLKQAHKQLKRFGYIRSEADPKVFTTWFDVAFYVVAALLIVLAVYNFGGALLLFAFLYGIKLVFG